jgi:hypothetical protein
MWSTLTLTIRLLTTMKKRSGTYFYSILVTTWGLSVRQVGNFVQFYAPSCPWQLGFTMQQLGWVGMITGFSMVLFSRLAIILESRIARRAVLGMIIFNGIVWHSAMITILSGMRTMQFSQRLGGKSLFRHLFLEAHRLTCSTGVRAWTNVHNRVEKVQVVMFSVQDIIISCLYVRAAYQYLQGRFTTRSKARNTMALLLFVQVLAILFDVAIVFMDFAGYLQLKFMSFSLVYAIKLELEFIALNQLVELSQVGVPGLASMSFAIDAALKTNENERIVKNMATTAIQPVMPKAAAESLEMGLELGSRTSEISQDGYLPYLGGSLLDDTQPGGSERRV